MHDHRTTRKSMYQVNINKTKKISINEVTCSVISILLMKKTKSFRYCFSLCVSRLLTTNTRLIKSNRTTILLGIHVEL